MYIKRNKHKQTPASPRAASTVQWKWHDPPTIPRRAATTARWNVHESDTTHRLYHRAARTARRNVHESDMTRRLHHAEPLVRHVEMYTKKWQPTVCTTQRPWYGTLKCTRKWYDPPSVPHRVAGMARWNVHESERIRHLYHAEPLVRHVEMYTKVTRPAVCTTHSL